MRPKYRNSANTHGGWITTASIAAAVPLAISVGSPPARAFDTLPFGETSVIIETNATDCDTGLQFMFDVDDWERVSIRDPEGRLVLDVRTRANLSAWGMTEQFNESSEPVMAELVALSPGCDPADSSLIEFKEVFPAGLYSFEGWTIDGDHLEGEAVLSHVIPAAPVVVTPADEDEVNPDKSLVVEWNPVVSPIATFPVVPGLGPVNIVAYQVIVQEDVDMPPEFVVDLPADITELTVSDEFLQPGKEYKLEVLAIDATGNQTLTELSFETSN